MTADLRAKPPARPPHRPAGWESEGPLYWKVDFTRQSGSHLTVRLSPNSQADTRLSGFHPDCQAFS